MHGGVRRLMAMPILMHYGCARTALSLSRQVVGKGIVRVERAFSFHASRITLPSC